MAEIKELNVQVTYRVGLTDIECSDSVYKGLVKISEGFAIDDSEIQMMKDEDMHNAWNWLTDNITDNDAFSLEYEVEDIE